MLPDLLEFLLYRGKSFSQNDCSKCLTLFITVLLFGQANNFSTPSKKKKNHLQCKFKFSWLYIYLIASWFFIYLFFNLKQKQNGCFYVAFISFTSVYAYILIFYFTASLSAVQIFYFYSIYWVSKERWIDKSCITILCEFKLLLFLKPLAISQVILILWISKNCHCKLPNEEYRAAVVLKHWGENAVEKHLA